MLTLRRAETYLERRAREALPDVVLLRLVAYEHITGPYRPTRPLLLSVAQRLVRVLFCRRSMR